ncbi:lytic transglycosylase domain-containing protein [bacterium]|nr:lytic transglycosylase domain-containing protein [bacterium]
MQEFRPTQSRAEIENLIEKYAQKNNLDKDFVKAVIKQESGFNAKATSHCGAMGLMQLMPQTAMSLGVENAYDVEQNIMGGTKYLSNLLNQYNGDKTLALAAYNAGPGAVKRYGGIPPYQETQNYVKKVIANYNNYKGGAV